MDVDGAIINNKRVIEVLLNAQKCNHDNISLNKGV